MSVTVIIPTWRRAPWLRQCLQAVLRQLPPPDEVIVVGRAEDAAAIQVTDEAASVASFPVRWTVVDRPGHIAPVRRGLEAATGDIVAFLDDDAEPLAGWLQTLLEPFLDSRVACVGGRVVTPGFIGRVHADAGCIRWYGRHIGNVGARADTAPVDVDGVMECNWAWRTKIIRRLSFDSRLDTHDAALYGLDLCLQAKDLGYRIVYEPRARVVHYQATRDPSLDRGDKLRMIRRYSRNYTLVALKHFRAVRRALFFLWWFLVGEKGSYGLATAIYECLTRQKGVGAAIRASFGGKVEGVKVWLTERP